MANPRFPLDTCPLRYVSAMPVEQIGFTLVYASMSSTSSSCYFSSAEHRQMNSDECMLLLNVFLIRSKH